MFYYQREPRSPRVREPDAVNQKQMMVAFRTDPSGPVEWVPAWNGGLDSRRRTQLEEYTRRVQHSLCVRLQEHPRWERLWSDGVDLRNALIAQDPWFLGCLRGEVASAPGLREVAGRTYRGLMMALVGIATPALHQGLPVGAAPQGTVTDRVRLFRPRAEDLADRALAMVGEPNDRWRRILVLGLLVKGELADWWRPLPFGLDAETGREEPWRRQIYLPPAVPNHVVEAAGRSRQAVERVYGVSDRTARPHPPRHRQGEPRRAFVDYVCQLHERGYSTQIIADDAEARRLYRQCRDIHAELTVAAVRYAIASRSRRPEGAGEKSVPKI